MPDFNGNNFFSIVYTAIVAIFGATAKEINDKAKGKESFEIFISEVILHGFSGWISGLLAIKYFKLDDLTSITIVAGIGGLFGYDLVKVIVKKVLDGFGNSKVEVKLGEEETKEDK